MFSLPSASQMAKVFRSRFFRYFVCYWKILFWYVTKNNLQWKRASSGNSSENIIRHRYVNFHMSTRCYENFFHFQLYRSLRFLKISSKSRFRMIHHVSNTNLSSLSANASISKLKCMFSFWCCFFVSVDNKKQLNIAAHNIVFWK